MVRTFNLSKGWWSQRRLQAGVDGSSKSIFGCFNILFAVDFHQFPAKILYFPKSNGLVYCSNYDRRFYRQQYRLLPSEEEEYGEHSCAPTDPDGSMNNVATAEGDILRLISAYQWSRSTGTDACCP